ncbi:MAG: ribonuclease P protein component [Elusimicrobiota bacterium]|jgi:ribonuclease P protein component|nr:ribonuclease P protein component [Elusimicrobiota bacterium]
MAEKKFSLTYREKLHLQKDFTKILKNGVKIENQIIKIFAYKNLNSANRRIGLITSKKVGKAHIRNRTKRRLREIFRTNKYFLQEGIDLIFISKPKTAAANYEDLKKTIIELLKKAGLYRI